MSIWIIVGIVIVGIVVLDRIIKQMIPRTHAFFNSIFWTIEIVWLLLVLAGICYVAVAGHPL